MPRRKQTPTQAALAVVKAANTEAQIIEAVAQYIWRRETGNTTACPADWLPSPASLARWLPECPATASTEACRRAGAILQTDAHMVLAAGKSGIVFKSESTAAVKLIDVHARWRDGRRAHPMTPIIQAYMTARPQRWNLRERRILPMTLIDAGKIDRRQKESADFNIAGASSKHGAQLWLPGSQDDRTQAWPVDLYYLGGKPGSSSGRRAPLALRLFVETLLSVDLDCGGLEQRMEIMPRDLMKMLFRDGERLGKVIERMRTAATAIHNLRVPVYNDRGGIALWSVINIRQIPLTADMPLVMEVCLPRGSLRGPQINRLALRAYGLDSAPLYRGLLNLTYHMHRKGETWVPADKRKTRWLYTTQPKAYGDRLLTADGNPAGPQAARVITQFFFPADHRKAHHHEETRRAIGHLHRLIDDGHARLVDGRVMPAVTAPKPAIDAEE